MVLFFQTLLLYFYWPYVSLVLSTYPQIKKPCEDLVFQSTFSTAVTRWPFLPFIWVLGQTSIHQHSMEKQVNSQFRIQFPVSLS